MSADTFVSPHPGEPSRERTNERTSERTNETSRVRSPYGANLRRALFAVFVANAITQFAIQAWMAWRFGAEVWRLPGPLAIGVPLALDVFVINLMVVAYLLRSARLRTRVYVWIALTIGIAAQLGAAESFADHKSWDLPARAASLVPAVFLALSLHTLIIVAQHSDAAADGQRRATWAEIRRVRATVRALRRSGAADPVVPPPVIRPYLQAEIVGLQAPPPAPEPAVTSPEPPPEAPPATRTRPATRPVRQKTAPVTRAKAGRRSTNPNRDVAVKRVLAGEPATEVARSLGENPRTVQLWVKAARDHAPSITGAPEIAAGETTAGDAPVPKDVR